LQLFKLRMSAQSDSMIYLQIYIVLSGVLLSLGGVLASDGVWTAICGFVVHIWQGCVAYCEGCGNERWTNDSMTNSKLFTYLLIHLFYAILARRCLEIVI
jgi:hypothetical protein